jgi:hypothetical protein
VTITFRAATTVETTSTTAAVSNVPTGTVDGDLLIWQVGTAGTSGVQATPTGWTLAKSLAGPSGLSSFVIWYRVAASEPASYTTGAFAAIGRRAVIMASYSGVDNTTPLDVAVPTITEGTTAVACPAITPVTAGAWVLGLATVVVGSGVINTTYSTSNLTAIDSQVTSTQGAATNAVDATGHFAWTSGAFTPAYTTSNASTRSIGATLALRPTVNPELVMAPRTY